MTKDKKTPINNYPHGITFRLDDATFAQLRQAAEAHGATPHLFARMLTLRTMGVQADLPQVKTRSVAADVLTKLQVEQVRQGNNLNQIAHATNRGDHGAVAGLSEWFETSHELMGRIADALGTTRNP
jgi:hypothetical protein